MNRDNALLTTAEQAVQLAQSQGADQVAASVTRQRDVSLSWRDGNLEKITDATSRSLSLQIYVDQRYTAVSTRDLRPDALKSFIENAVSLARSLEQDPYRSLPDPKLYEGQSKVSLDLYDERQKHLTPEARKDSTQALEEAMRSFAKEASILSLESYAGDTLNELAVVHSNGFSATEKSTSFWLRAGLSLQDSDGRRPKESAYAVACHAKHLPHPQKVGKEAAERSLARLGAKKLASGKITLMVESRVASRLLSFLLDPLSARSLQQQRSFLVEKVGQAFGSKLLHIEDDPLIPQGLGSRLFDGEGLAAKPFTVFSEGNLTHYYVDDYYGKKLAMAPTTASPSNHRWRLGEHSGHDLLKNMDEGLLVTGFLGGNSNSATGDFSLGVQGFHIVKGALAEPVSEMNLSGNHLNFWQHLIAVGNDPYPYSRFLTPTLVFGDAMVSGL